LNVNITDCGVCLQESLEVAGFRHLTGDVEAVRAGVNLDEILTDGSIVEVAGTSPSVVDPRVQVKVVLMKLDGTNLTKAEETGFMKLIEGREPTEIPLKRYSKKRPKSPTRRRIERLIELRKSISYMEITEVEQDEANAFIRADGIERGGSQSGRYWVNCICFCEDFFDSGRACRCSLVYGSRKGYLGCGLRLKTLFMTKLMAGKRRVGRPVKKQMGFCQAWQQSRNEGWQASDGGIGSPALSFIKDNNPMRMYGWHVAFMRQDDEQRSVFEAGVVRDYRDTVLKNENKQKGAGIRREWGIAVDGVDDVRYIDAEALARALMLASEIGLDANPSEIPAKRK
jgi:hypothetical protein